MKKQTLILALLSLVITSCGYTSSTKEVKKEDIVEQEIFPSETKIIMIQNHMLKDLVKESNIKIEELIKEGYHIQETQIEERMGICYITVSKIK